MASHTTVWLWLGGKLKDHPFSFRFFFFSSLLFSSFLLEQHSPPKHYLYTWHYLYTCITPSFPSWRDSSNVTMNLQMSISFSVVNFSIVFFSCMPFLFFEILLSWSGSTQFSSWIFCFLLRVSDVKARSPAGLPFRMKKGIRKHANPMLLCAFFLFPLMFVFTFLIQYPLLFCPVSRAIFFLSFLHLFNSVISFPALILYFFSFSQYLFEKRWVLIGILEVEEEETKGGGSVWWRGGGGGGGG